VNAATSRLDLPDRDMNNAIPTTQMLGGDSVQPVRV
jgi:hypothetical protein